MRLFHTVLREIPENLKSLMLMNIASAIAVVAFVGLVSTAAQTATAGQVSARLMLMFAITVVLSHLTHMYCLVTASRDTERLIHKLRIHLFDLVRRTDLVTVDRIGRAALQGVLTQDTQILAQVLPMLVIGFQQAVMLLFLAIYLAWLSPLACVLAFGLAGLTVMVRFARVNSLKMQMQSASEAEARVFDGLTDLLRGFKEIRMNGPRADDLVEKLAVDSGTSRKNNGLLKAQWGRNFAVMEVMLYCLIGVIVFVVPLFATGFHQVVLPTTLAVLFIAGPVGTLCFVTPMVTQAEMALENIAGMEHTLAAVAETVAGEAGGALKAVPLTIALANAEHSYRDAHGQPLFTVGPLTAQFHAGEITFITGGNGSGKSTLLRLLTGLIPLDSGQLLANGQPLATGQMQHYRDNISAIFADFHLSRRLDHIANLDPARIRFHLARLEMQHKVTVANGLFSTIDLSAGQRKRLAFVVSELEDKPIIVLDEWAADQDPHFRRIFYEQLLPDLKNRGKIVICVTHDDRWFHLADRLYHMDEGRMTAIHRS